MKNKRLFLSFWAIFLLTFFPQNAQSAVGNGIAWVSSTQTTNSTDLHQTIAYALSWSASDYDDDYFSYSAGSPSRLTVDSDGDYLIALTLPMYRADVINNRTNVEAEVRVNGTKVDVGLARSSYNRGRTYHHKASDHLHVLLENLSASDYIEIFVKAVCTVNINRPVYVDGIASLYAEFIDTDQTVFTATATQTTNSTNFNQVTAYELAWTESRKDTGYTHSNVTAPEDITLDAAGDYLVFINIPLNGAILRANVKGKVLIGGTKITGGQFKQGYIRNGDGHTEASIHFSGVVTTASAAQVLSISAELEGAAGVVTAGSDKATIYIQKLPSTGVYFSNGTELTSGTTWNPATAVSIKWENASETIDTNTFTHSVSSNAEQITIDADGDYLVIYNDSLTAAAARPNPVITVNVNGTPISGAQTTTHYIRASSQNESSGSLVFFLRDLTANDIISFTTEIDTDNDTTNDDDNALVFIWHKVIGTPIDASGTIYTNEAKTLNIGANKTVALSVDGGAIVTDETDASGQFSFTNVLVDVDKVISIYLDDETENASLVTVTDGSTDLTGGAALEMYTEKIVLEYQTGTSLTNAQLDLIDGVDIQDEDGITISGSNVTFADGFEVWIDSGMTYTPGGTVEADAFEINGTAVFNPAANAVTISGDFTIGSSATFTTSGTVTFDGSTKQILSTGGTDASHDFQNLTHSGDGELELDASYNLDIDSTFTQSGSGDFDTQGSDLTINTLTVSNGTFNTDARAGTWNIGSGALAISGGTFTATSGIINASGSISNSGTFTHNSGTLNLNATGGTPTIIALPVNGAFNDLDLNCSGITYTMSSAIDIDGALDIVAGTLDADSNDINIGGDWTVHTSNGSFVSGINDVGLMGRLPKY